MRNEWTFAGSSELSIGDQRHIFKYQDGFLPEEFYVGMRGRIVDLVDGSVDVIKFLDRCAPGHSDNAPQLLFKVRHGGRKYKNEKSD